MTDQLADGRYLTRSEERLTVGTEVSPVRRAVLRVETTSEQVMVPVTITRQHARLEYLDPDGATPVDPDQLLHGAAGTWLVLTADEPVVTTRPVPVERVRLVTSWVTAQQDVQVQLAHEEVTQEVLPAQTTGRPVTP